MINWNSSEPNYNLIEWLNASIEAAKAQFEREQERISDPCWHKECSYVIPPQVFKMLESGDIEEWQLPAYALEVREVWVNDCDK